MNYLLEKMFKEQGEGNTLGHIHVKVSLITL